MSKQVLTLEASKLGVQQALSMVMVLSLMMVISISFLSPYRGKTDLRANGSSVAAPGSGQSLMAEKGVMPNMAGLDQMQVPFGQNTLLQFTSGRHVLGFRPKEMFLAASDHALKVEFLGARAVVPDAEGKLEARTYVSQAAGPLGRVTYPDLWDRVSLVYEESPGAVVKSTYHVAPRTAEIGHTSSPVDQIRLRYNVPVRVDGRGNLVMSFGTGEMWESAPVAWQEIGGKRVPVEVAYCLLGEREVGFSVGNHDPLIPLVIDPKLVWNTFMGSAGDDYGYSIAVDSSGNVYASGGGTATWGAPVNAYAGGDDVFVARLNSAGALQWNTFMGSAGNDYYQSIAVDSSGNVYVTGHSDATWGAPVNGHAGGWDAFVARLDSAGALQWNTFMGSAGDDYAYSIAVDSSGNVYVTGHSDATWGAPVNAYVGGYDVFVARLNSAGALQWNTFMGSAGNDYGRSIAVDNTGFIYVIGWSSATWGAPVNAYAGQADVFVARLNSAGALQWNTFMGSAGNDFGYSIAVNSSGNVYVTGYSTATWGAPVNGYAGGDEAFAAKLNNAGVRQWNTFMGSGGNDEGLSIGVDGSGNVYVTGRSPATWGAPVNGHAGGMDAFVAKLNSAGARQWNTFMGSLGIDSGDSIAVDSSGNVYVTGYSTATWGAPVNPYAGGQDAFVAKHTSSDIKPKQFYFNKAHNLKD